MTELYRTRIYFAERTSPVEILLSEGDARVVDAAVTRQVTAYDITGHNWVDGKETHSITINGRNVDMVTSEKYDLPS